MLSQKHTLCRAAMVVLFGLTALTACGSTNQLAAPAPTPSSSGTAADSPLKVVATFSVLGDLVRNVAGDLIEIKTLVPPGADAHAFEPSPADSVALAEAQVVFENGLEFEPWAADLFTASDSQALRIALAEGIEFIAAEEGEHDQEGQEGEHAKVDATTGADEHAEETARPESGEGEHSEDEHGEYDPHVWHDVNNAVIMVEHIRDGLTQTDPANAEIYQANADTYLQQLKDLDAFVVERISALPVERRKLVTTHDTFGYFARRYGFEIVGTTLGSVSTEVADPSAADIVELVEQIKVAGVPAIFAENIDSGGVTERVAREAGVELAPTLYTDALGEPGSDGATYEQMMRYNVETIVTALGQ